MRTTAVKKGNKYVINGSKTFITNGVYADYYIVAAKTSPDLGNKGISIFLMDTNLKGINATKLDKLGWRASDTAEISFDNVEIPEENLMGEADKGFPYIMQHFALERLIMAVNAHARAEYAIDYTIEYMSQREAFGTTINKFQALRHTMVDHATEVEHCKIFNYAAVARLDKGEYVVKEATMAKLKSTKVADEAIYSCLQMLGGYGYMEEYPLARLLRDSRLGPIGGGTSEILREILSKMIIDKQSYQPAVK
jgi:alkylation response protein AidB-like acyl-CoA dehydrogenase